MRKSESRTGSGEHIGAVMAGRRLGLLAGALMLGVVPYVVGQEITEAVDEHVRRATVMVKTAWSERSEGDSPLGSGTGFFVNATGLCITNDHVTDPAHGKGPAEKMQASLKYNRLTWTVVVNSGTDEEKTYKANVLYSNDQADMAVMQVYDEEREFLATPDYLRFRSTEDVPKKLKVWNYGFPGGEARRQSQDRSPLIALQWGNVVELSRSPTGRVKGIVTNVLANQGNSGGPAVDAEGRLVGIVTLGSGGDEGRSAMTILIPADLTREMIRIAFEEGKVPEGVDILPFVDLFVSPETRVFRLPMMERREGVACAAVDSAVMCGAPKEKTHTWQTPLGEIELPNSALAYEVSGEDFGVVLLDGGDRLRIEPEGSIDLSMGGGNTVGIELDEVKSIAFAPPKAPPSIPEGEVLVIGGRDFRLSLKKAKGAVAFEPTGASDVLQIPLSEIARIDQTEDEETRLHTKRGSRMTGSFSEHEIRAELAWTGTPVTLSFEDVAELENLDIVIKTVDFRELYRVGEPLLTRSITTTDRRFVRLAEHLEKRDLESAKALLDQLRDRDTVRGMSKAKKEELRRLEGEYYFLAGEFNRANDVFRKLSRASVEDVRWHAQARAALLARFDDGKYDDKPLSDPKAFGQAGAELASEQILEAMRIIEELEDAAGGRPVERSEYNKLVRRAKKAEEMLLVANRLRGGTTEGLLVRLWRDARNLHLLEASRLQAERQEFEESSRGRSSGRGANRLSSQARQREQRVRRFERDLERAIEAAGELEGKIQNAGFIIDDTDRDFGDGG